MSFFDARLTRLSALFRHGAGALRPPGPFVAPLAPRCALTSAPSPREGLFGTRPLAGVPMAPRTTLMPTASLRSLPPGTGTPTWRFRRHASNGRGRNVADADRLE